MRYSCPVQLLYLHYCHRFLLSDIKCPVCIRLTYEVFCIYWFIESGIRDVCLSVCLSVCPHIELNNSTEAVVILRDMVGCESSKVKVQRYVVAGCAARVDE